MWQSTQKATFNPIFDLTREQSFYDPMGIRTHLAPIEKSDRLNPRCHHPLTLINPPVFPDQCTMICLSSWSLRLFHQVNVQQLNAIWSDISWGISKVTTNQECFSSKDEVQINERNILLHASFAWSGCQENLSFLFRWNEWFALQVFPEVY